MKRFRVGRKFQIPFQDSGNTKERTGGVSLQAKVTLTDVVLHCTRKDRRDTHWGKEEYENGFPPKMCQGSSAGTGGRVNVGIHLIGIGPESDGEVLRNGDKTKRQRREGQG